MVTLYDRDARAVSELLELLVRYHEDFNNRQANLTTLSNWGMRGDGDRLEAIGVGTRLARHVGTTPGNALAVADYLSSIRAEIEGQLGDADS
jgi:hypothetical protein